METRELLELAAKAAGKHGHQYVDAWNCMAIPEDQHRYCHESIWSSLADDGDCARMETAIEINVVFHQSNVVVIKGDKHIREYYAHHNGDKNKARRYASTRLAAEIGRAMP